LYGFTGTVFGPSLGLLGFGLGVGDGIDLLRGFTGTVLFAMNYEFKIEWFISFLLNTLNLEETNNFLLSTSIILYLELQL